MLAPARAPLLPLPLPAFTSAVPCQLVYVGWNFSVPEELRDYSVKDAFSAPARLHIGERGIAAARRLNGVPHAGPASRVPCTHYNLQVRSSPHQHACVLNGCRQHWACSSHRSDRNLGCSHADWRQFRPAPSGQGRHALPACGGGRGSSAAQLVSAALALLLPLPPCRSRCGALQQLRTRAAPGSHVALT